MLNKGSSYEPVKYGNLLRPKMPGIQGISPVQFGVMLLCTIPMVLLITLGNIFVALIWVSLASLAIAPWVIGTMVFDTNPYSILHRKFSYRRAERKGLTTLLQGPISLTHENTLRLPGIMATSMIVKAVDVFHNEYGIIIHQDTDEYTVVVEVHPDDITGIDHKDIDLMAAKWGAFLSLLSREPDITGVQVVVETVPDTGVRISQAANQERDQHAPPLALAVLDDVINNAPVGSAQISTCVSLTFSGKIATEDSDGKRHQARFTADEMADSIGTRLPTLMTQLQSTGAGQLVRARTAEDIIDSTRVAFDPSVSADVEVARSSGGTGISWDEAGPSFARSYRGEYLHDSCTSTSWVMKEPTSGNFDALALKELLSPNSRIERKRVAICYRLMDPSRSALTAEWRVTAASVDSDTRKKSGPSQRHSAKLRAARANAEAEAAGATFVRFGLVATVTSSNEDALPLQRSTMEGIAHKSRLTLRKAYGYQDLAFVSSLPLGIVIPNRVAIPSFLRDGE